MRMWDVLTMSQWEELQRSGVLRDLSDGADLDPADPGYNVMMEPHRWFHGQVAQRIGPAPEGARFPTELYGLEKPDMRTTNFEGMGDEVVRVRLDVPDDQLVLFDDGGWCLALMLAPVFWTEGEYDAFDAELAAKGFDYSTRWDAGSAELRALISGTWEKIFDAEAAWGDGSTPPCAAVWQLRLEWVRSAERFKTRKSSCKDAPTGDRGSSANEIADDFMDEYSAVFEDLAGGAED